MLAGAAASSAGAAVAAGSAAISASSGSPPAPQATATSPAVATPEMRMNSRREIQLPFDLRPFMNFLLNCASLQG